MNLRGKFILNFSSLRFFTQCIAIIFIFFITNKASAQSQNKNATDSTATPKDSIRVRMNGGIIDLDTLKKEKRIHLPVSLILKKAQTGKITWHKDIKGCPLLNCYRYGRRLIGNEYEEKPVLPLRQGSGELSDIQLNAGRIIDRPPMLSPLHHTMRIKIRPMREWCLRRAKKR